MHRLADVGRLIVEARPADPFRQQVRAVAKQGVDARGDREGASGGLADEAAALRRAREEAALSRIEIIKQYAELSSCRRRFLLHYFGEPFGATCGFCDNCESGRGVAAPLSADSERPFPLESWVRHPDFGRGVVTRYVGERVVVVFERQGEKTLALRPVADGELLRPIEAEAGVGLAGTDASPV